MTSGYPSKIAKRRHLFLMKCGQRRAPSEEKVLGTRLRRSNASAILPWLAKKARLAELVEARKERPEYRTRVSVCVLAVCGPSRRAPILKWQRLVFPREYADLACEGG
jgi:hypothetical protein